MSRDVDGPFHFIRARAVACRGMALVWAALFLPGRLALLSEAAEGMRGEADARAEIVFSDLADSGGSMVEARELFGGGGGGMALPNGSESPAPVAAFLALPDSNDRTPPDTQGAVGRRHLLATLNTSVRVQSRTGESLKTMALSAFWSSLGDPDPFDPKCAYDPVAQRWIFATCANLKSAQSAFLIGVSHTEDPAAGWHLFRLDNVGGGTTWIDYPNVGFNRKWIAVQALLKRVPGDEFVESRIYAFDKTDLYNGGSGRFSAFTLAGMGRVQAPAVTLDPEVEDLFFMSVPAETDASVGELRVYRLTGEIGLERFEAVSTLTAPQRWHARMGSGNVAPQLGSDQKIHLQDGWMQTVVYRNKALWAAHHIFLPVGAPTRSAVQWFQLTPEAILQSGRIENESAGYFYGYPSLGVNGRNDVLIGFTRFAADAYAAAGYAFRFGVDPLNHVRGDRIFKAGEGVYYKTRGQTRNRWGDFSSTVVDPLDELALWTIQEYAAAPVGDPAVDGSGRWGTWWAQVPAGSLQPEDADSDGMPSFFEEVYGLDANDPADAGRDGDGDGCTNLQEFYTQTDPRDPRSALQLDVRQEPSGVSLSFQTVFGRRYVLEWLDQVGGTWAVLRDVIGTGSTARVSDSSNGAPTRYYQLRLEL